VLGARTCWNNRKRRGGRGSKTSSLGVDPERQKYPSEDLSGHIKTEMAGSRQKGGTEKVKQSQ
jgi:hypothetical protein